MSVFMSRSTAIYGSHSGSRSTRRPFRHACLKSRRPYAGSKAFGDNGVEFDLRISIDSPESGVGNVTSDVFFRIWDLFKEHGVTMPVPQRDLRFRPPLVEVSTCEPQQPDVPGPTR